MSVAQPDDVAYHRHDGGGAGVALGDVIPLIGPRAGAPQLSEETYSFEKLDVQVNILLVILIFPHYVFNDLIDLDSINNRDN